MVEPSSASIHSEALQATLLASETDTRGDMPYALTLYITAIGLLIKAIQSKLYSDESDPIVKAEIREKTKATISRAEEIKKNLPPSDLRQKNYTENQSVAEVCFVCDRPQIGFTSVLGLEQAKEGLIEHVILPIRFPAMFRNRSSRTNSAVLIHGPSGCGKSLLAHACAGEGLVPFFQISCCEVFNHKATSPDMTLRAIFKQARDQSPSILCLEEADALLGQEDDSEHMTKRRIQTEFLVQMQGLYSQSQAICLIILTTNRPWELPRLVLRLMDWEVYIPLPDCGSRRQLFRKFAGDVENDINEKDWDALGRDSDMFSGSDIQQVVKNTLFDIEY